jgi:hypothetical protein
MVGRRSISSYPFGVRLRPFAGQIRVSVTVRSSIEGRVFLLLSLVLKNGIPNLVSKHVPGQQRRS